MTGPPKLTPPPKPPKKKAKKAKAPTWFDRMVCKVFGHKYVTVEYVRRTFFTSFGPDYETDEIEHCARCKEYF